MDFAFSPEQEKLRRPVRQFLDKTSPETEVRRLMATECGYDADAWHRMADELELLGLAFARAALAGFKVPAQWEFVSPLPRNATGKLLRRQLHTGGHHD